MSQPNSGYTKYSLKVLKWMKYVPKSSTKRMTSYGSTIATEQIVLGPIHIFNHSNDSVVMSFQCKVGPLVVNVTDVFYVFIAYSSCQTGMFSMFYPRGMTGDWGLGYFCWFFFNNTFYLTLATLLVNVVISFSRLLSNDYKIFTLYHLAIINPIITKSLD